MDCNQKITSPNKLSSAFHTNFYNCKVFPVLAPSLLSQLGKILNNQGDERMQGKLMDKQADISYTVYYSISNVPFVTGVVPNTVAIRAFNNQR